MKLVNASPGIDRQIVNVDIGKSNLAVGIIHRGKTGAPAAGRRGRGSSGTMRRACGGASASGHGERHLNDGQTETYIIVSGSGTLVTGGRIVNGRKSAPESSVTKVLNGPSCSGPIDGADVVKNVVKTGDIIIIPAGVPHGWADIGDHVDYLSVVRIPIALSCAGT